MQKAPLEKFFSVPWKSLSIQGSTIECELPQSTPARNSLGPVFVLHGAGASEASRFLSLRQRLAWAGLRSIAFDFVGHGKTGGTFAESSLAARDEQSLAVLNHCRPARPSVLWGSSMGAYNAVRLSSIVAPNLLILSVPAVYHPGAYHLPFGPEFTQMIRQERSWELSDAWDLLSHFSGHVLILVGGEDQVIPEEIPERLFQSARKARSRQIRHYANADHHVIRYLEQSPLEFDELMREVAQLAKNTSSPEQGSPTLTR